MEVNDLESLRDRLARLERLVGELAGLSSETSDIHCRSLTAGQVILVDHQGRPAFTIGPDLDAQTTRSLIIRDLNGVNRIALGINNDNRTYINLFDRDGNWVKAVGEQQPRP